MNMDINQWVERTDLTSPITGLGVLLVGRDGVLLARSKVDSQLGSMCECGRRTSGCIGLIAEVHGCDKTAVHGEYVDNLAVRKNIPFKTLDELVHPDAGLASVFLGHCKRFDMGIELTSLSSPIVADLFFSDNLAALRSLGPAHVLRHQC